MPIRRKRFPCGHKGQGQSCHRCAQQDTIRLHEQRVRQAKATAKRASEEAFLHDPINLRALPSKRLVSKARQILHTVIVTRAYRPFFGKRMDYDRSVLSVPINYRYRLLFKIRPDRIVPLSVMSHETYNHAKDRVDSH